MSDTWDGKGDWTYKPRRRFAWLDVLYIVALPVVLAALAIAVLWPDLVAGIVSAVWP